MRKKDVVINTRRVYKSYKLPIKGSEEFHAIKDLSIKIKRGDKLGIIGDNGAGKTTLLKLIAGVTRPTRGTIEVEGKIASLINLEAGFNSELTGRENILLNGMIHGLAKEDVQRKMDSIIRFADIGKFIDVPYFVYSSGMKFRLALSVSLAIKPDIVLMDEVFMVGDIDFQIKTYKKIEQLTRDKRVTLIIDSHYPLILRKFCNRFLLLKNGQMMDSSIKSVLGLTQKWNNYFIDVPETEIEKKLANNPFYQR